MELADAEPTPVRRYRGRAQRGRRRSTQPTRQGRKVAVPVTTLSGNHHLKVRVTLNTFAKFLPGGIRIHIEASKPVDVFVVDDAGLRDFEAGRQFPTFYSVRGQLALHTSVQVQPMSSVAHVVIVNHGPETIAVYYDVE